MITGAEADKYYKQGVEAMRQRAIEKVTAWHVAKWNESESLSVAEVHDLINAIAGDIQVALP